MDDEKKVKILHCAKRLLKIEELFNAEVDRLLDDLGLTREEVKNGSVPEKVGA